MWLSFKGRLYTIAILYVLSFNVRILYLHRQVCVFLIPLVYFFRFFSEYISLFCIYYLVWLCIAFFWFNCCYKKPLCEKTETWSLLEWSKEVHLFRVWLTQTLKQWFTLKLITLVKVLSNWPLLCGPQSVPKSVRQLLSVIQSLGELLSLSIIQSVDQSLILSASQVPNCTVSQSVSKSVSCSISHYVSWSGTP